MAAIHAVIGEHRRARAVAGGRVGAHAGRAPTLTGAARCSRPARSTSGTATRSLRRGELAEARQELEAAFGAFEGWGYGSEAEVYVRSFLALALLEQGDAPRRGGCSSAAASRPTSPRDGARYWLLARLGLELAEGRAARGRDARADRPRLPGRGERGLQSVARLRRRGARPARRHERALELAREEVELARRWGAPGRARPHAARAAGRWSATSGSTTRRQSSCCRLAAPARAREGARRARLGAPRGRKPTDAREPLRLALELADACGAAAVSPRTSAPSSTRRARGPRTSRSQRRRLAHRRGAARREPRRRGPDEPRHRTGAASSRRRRSRCTSRTPTASSASAPAASWLALPLLVPGTVVERRPVPSLRRLREVSEGGPRKHWGRG